MTDAILEFFKWLPDEIYVFVISMLPIIELRGAIPVAAVMGIKFYPAYPLSVVGNLLPVPFILLFISGMMDYLYKFKIFRPVIDFLRKKANKHSKRVLVDTPSDTNNLSASDFKAENPLAYQSSCADEECLALPADKLDGIKNAEGASGFAEADASRKDEGIEGLGYTSSSTEILANAEDNTYSPSEKDCPDILSGGYAEEAYESDLAQKSKPAQRTGKMSRGVFVALMLFVAVPLPGTGAWTGALVSSLFGLPKKASFLSIAFGVLISGIIMSLASYGVLEFLSFLK